MAIKFGNGLDLDKSELQNARIQNLSSNPSAPVEGQLYYSTTDSVLKLYNGATWLDLAISTGTSTITGVTGTNGVTASETGGVVTVQHADTSSIVNTSNTSNTVIQNITWDGLGHAQTVSNKTITLSGLGYTGATDADNYNGFLVAGNTGTTSNIGSGNTLTLNGDGNNITANALEVTITNTDKGSAQNIFKNIAGDTGTAAAGSNTDTLTFTGGDGITTTVSDTGGNAVVSQAVNATVVRTTGEQTIGGNKTFTNNVTIDGNLTVSGDTISTLSETVNVEDSLLYLNSNAPDVPVDDSGFLVDRGLQTNSGVIWDESADQIAAIFTEDDGTGTGNIVITGYADFRAKDITAEKISLSNLTAGVSDYDKFLVQDGNEVKTRTGAQVRSDIGAGTVSSVAISTTAPLVVNSGSPVTTTGTINLSVSSATTSAVGVVELATAAEARAMSSSDVVVTAANLGDLRASVDIGDGVATSFAIEHNLGSRDVIVQMYDNATYETVYTDTVRTDTNTVTVSFTSAPTTNQYRVLIIMV